MLPVCEIVMSSSKKAILFQPCKRASKSPILRFALRSLARSAFAVLNARLDVSSRKPRVAPVLWDLDDEGSRPWRSRHPLCDVVGLCLLAAEDDEQNAELRRQADGRLKA